jgi:hypothetical protein
MGSKLAMRSVGWVQESSRDGIIYVGKKVLGSGSELGGVLNACGEWDPFSNTL